MSHAFLIISHDHPQLTARLARRLADVGPVHLHVEARSGHDFSAARRWAQQVPDPVAVHWGGWSLVRAVAKTARQALADPDVTRISLLSGRHYPLVDPARLTDLPDLDHIGMRPSPSPETGKPRSRFEHPYVSRFPRTSRRSVVVNGLLRRTPRIDFERALGGRRLYTGPMWWSLTRTSLEGAMAELASDRRMCRYFSRIAVPDESAFQTATGAALSRRYPHLAPEDITGRDTTFASWIPDTPHPQDLTAELVRTAQADGWWFARKSTPELCEVAEAGWPDAVPHVTPWRH